MGAYVNPLYIKETEAIFSWYAITVFCKFIFLTLTYYKPITENTSQCGWPPMSEIFAYDL